MKKLASKKSLQLSKQTVRVLSDQGLELAAGGWVRATGYASCTSICSQDGSCGCVPTPA